MSNCDEGILMGVKGAGKIVMLDYKNTYQSPNIVRYGILGDGMSMNIIQGCTKEICRDGTAIVFYDHENEKK